MSDRDDEILQEFERRSRADTEGVRQMLYAEGRPDLVVNLNARLRDIDSGVYGARVTWRALSEPQRRMLRLATTHKRLRRAAASRSGYDASGGPDDAEANVGGIATVRNLIARELLICDGGAFDPKAVVVISERGRFVLSVCDKP